MVMGGRKRQEKGARSSFGAEMKRSPLKNHPRMRVQQNPFFSPDQSIEFHHCQKVSDDSLTLLYSCYICFFMFCEDKKHPLKCIYRLIVSTMR